MNIKIVLAFIIAALVGCKSTDPRIDYFEKNYGDMTLYNTKHDAELGVLVNKINEECVFKKMNSGNVSFASLMSIPINGIVIYDLNEKGVVSSVLYVSKDEATIKRRKQKCISDVAIGTQLPVPKELTRVYSKFEVNIEN